MIKGEPEIKLLAKKKLVGHAIEMSLIASKNFELFSGFMPSKNQIVNAIGADLYEVQVYDASYFKNFNPNKLFTKWAAVEVTTFENIPEGMTPLTLEHGMYAVFNYKGLAKNFSTLMQYIFTEWLPQSEFELDSRPHFNVLGNKYKNNHPDSEEDVYIPIKKTNKNVVDL